MIFRNVYRYCSSLSKQHGKHNRHLNTVTDKNSGIFFLQICLWTAIYFVMTIQGGDGA